MTQPFPSGTIVYLKTGSPPLIVNSLQQDGRVSVEWFDAAGLHRDIFDVECIFEETPMLEDMRYKCLNRMRGMLDSSAKVMVQAGDREPEYLASDMAGDAKEAGWMRP